MINIINYYYNFNIKNIKNENDNYYFEHKGNSYIFKIIDNDNIRNVLYTLSFINNNKIHSIINNRNNEIITFDGFNSYVLLKVKINNNNKIDIEDIIGFSNENLKTIEKVDINNYNWIDMWIKKIDYIEKYIEETENINYKQKCIINYFVGMAENSVNFIKEVNDNNKSTIKMSVQHKRIKKDYTITDLYDPFNIVVDVNVRDVAEYIRMLFCENELSDSKLKEIVYQTQFSSTEYKLMVGRLMFPAVFFDILEQNIIEEKNDKSVIKIYDKINEYELMIRKTIQYIDEIKKIDFPKINGITY